MGIIRSIFGNSEGPPRICQTKWYSRGSGINNRNDPNKKVHLLETFFPERVRELISCSCWLRLMRAYLHPWAGISSAVDIMASNDSSMTSIMTSNDSSMTQRCTYQHQHHQGHFSSFSSTLFIHTLVKIRPRRNNATNSGLSHNVSEDVSLLNLRKNRGQPDFQFSVRCVRGLVNSSPMLFALGSTLLQLQECCRTCVCRPRLGGLNFLPEPESECLRAESCVETETGETGEWGCVHWGPEWDTIHLTQSSAHKTNRLFLLGKNSSSLIGIYKKFIQ